MFNIRDVASFIPLSVLILSVNSFASELGSDKTEARTKNPPLDTSVIWAVNQGGPAYRGVDGIAYEADSTPSGKDTGRIDSIKGAQDDFVYKSYRTGGIHLLRDVENGNYSITFRFAEPDDVAIGERVFNVNINGETVLANLDVRLARDNNHKASLDRTVPNIKVENGKLEVAFQAVTGAPILSAIVVRKTQSHPERWDMVWSDEFNQTEPDLDQSKWSFDVWPAGKVNREDQAYTNRKKNVRVENGTLVLEAHKEKYDDAEFTSGRVHSAGKADMLYGRAEIRAKLPAGQGTWAALWMLPTDPFKYATSCNDGEDWQGSESCDAWPNSGEIDIMEHVGYDMNRVHGTVHTKAYYWVNGEQRKATIEASPVNEEFHTYAMEWSPERIDIFCDDVLYFTYLNELEGWQAWPFDHPYHFVLNLAVGGDWGRAGGPIDTDIFPARIEVDFVRVYEKASRVAHVTSN